jgi:Cytochrome P460
MEAHMKRILLLTIAAWALGAQSTAYEPQYTKDGELLLPREYREWVFLSAGLGMTYGPAASSDPQNPRFDNVFVSPSSYRAFLATGKWPDKTVFILEIRQSVGKGSINNGGHYQGEIVSVEAEVKDERRFPQHWAYFGFGHGDKARPAPATSTCNSCHGANAAVENTFVQFYPTLLEVATQKKTLNPAYAEKAVAGH